MRYLMLGAAIAAVAFLHVTHALALGSGDVAMVTEILEELAPERGEAVYYDEEAAADWYEFDADGPGLIAAAGFSADSWRESYDRTLMGLIALVPQAEFEELHADLEKKVATIPGLTEEQKEQMVADWRAHAGRFAEIREQGRAHAETVRPFAARLRALADF